MNESWKRLVNEDRRLQLAFLNPDLAVIVEQSATVNRNLWIAHIAQHIFLMTLIKGSFSKESLSLERSFLMNVLK